MTRKILLCGTPGTGKTHICQLLSSTEKLSQKLSVINISDVVISEKLFSEYDDDLNSAIIDEKKLRKKLQELLESSGSSEIVVIECHSVGCVSRKLVDQVVVLQANTEVLYDRLRERKYSKRKIEENMDCEIMQVILEEAIERFSGVSVKNFINNTSEDAGKIVEYIKSL